MSHFTRDSYVPGPSKAEESDTDSNSQTSEEAKIQLKTALVYCEQLLLENNKIATEPSAVIKEEHMKIGEKLYSTIMETLAENIIVIEDDLILFEEADEEGLFEEVEDSGLQSDDEYHPDEKRSKIDTDDIPLDYKIKRMDQLKIWEEQIRRGGSTKDKYTTIDKWTHDRFVEARQSNQQVTTRNLQQWALAAASQFPDLEFKASEAWEETHAAAEKFRLNTRALIPNYDKDFVLNTDQTGCQYQSTYNRTLAEQESKVVLVKRKDMNKVTHSYTAQYVMTLFGKLLPTVFICLQEANGNFGPRVQKSVDEYAKIYTNVAITSSKSGKLTTALYKDFLIDVMKPYVKEEKFIFLIDSWGGQTNPVLYDEIFTDDKGIPTCTMKVIPPKCTPLGQPCDVYFYRQVKNFIKRLQNCAYIIEQDREISSREDCIKIQSLVHHQLSTPIFCCMLKYAWCAAKLCDDRTSFMNVNEVCFRIDVLKNSCECKNSAFITCARCRNNYCFPCFYDRYHPTSCSNSALEQHDSE
ncbi:HTH CENPB-type domain-containing protein [Trichonephila clavipes]|nr:HTH CENPB-type domain-containing protein [Trichonephila clavipes]